MIINRKIAVVGFDPSIRNWGIATATVDVDTLEVAIASIELVETEKDQAKTVRRSSDDLRRATELHDGMVAACKDGIVLAMAEIPTGTQSASGMKSNGICIGVLAACPLPLIEVNPTEVKMAAIGKKNASKSEMIEWAMTKYPTLNWLTRTVKGKRVPLNDNEHLADAIATIHAGVKTALFQSLVAVYRTSMTTAAA
jgi:Holliday junction resolvasome RuvABC endonuclease subunit